MPEKAKIPEPKTSPPVVASKPPDMKAKFVPPVKQIEEPKAKQGTEPKTAGKPVKEPPKAAVLPKSEKAAKPPEKAAPSPVAAVPEKSAEKKQGEQAAPEKTSQKPLVQSTAKQTEQMKQEAFPKPAEKSTKDEPKPTDLPKAPKDTVPSEKATPLPATVNPEKKPVPITPLTEEKPKQEPLPKAAEKSEKEPIKSEAVIAQTIPAAVNPEKNQPVPTAEKPSEKRTEPRVVVLKPSEKPVKQEPAATPPPAASPRGTANLKGVTITQVFADRLNYPSADDLKSLPIPKEGEGFSMRLHPSYFFHFLDHPFSINREVKDYKDLYESIRENGINEPIKARPRAEGGLELLSGHRRHDVARQLNYPVPVVIVQADDDTARIEVVDGNLHRQDIPTSELARAAKMKMEALARKAGRRSKLDQLVFPQKRTDQIVAEDMGMSRNQVNRLVRIDALVPELKQQVDDKKLPFNTAVELSYMKPDEQNKVVDFMAKEQVVPSMAQASALKEASRQAETQAKNTLPSAPKPTVDEKKIESIIKPKKEPELKVTFNAQELAPYFPDRATTPGDVKRAVFEALDLRKKLQERRVQKNAIQSPKKPER